MEGVHKRALFWLLGGGKRLSMAAFNVNKYYTTFFL